MAFPIPAPLPNPDYKPPQSKHKKPIELIPGTAPHRLDPNDFARISKWLFPKLAQRWPTYNDRAFLNMLQSFLTSNTHNAFCTENAIAAAYITTEPRDPGDYCELMWVVHNSGYLEDAILCINALVDWAKRKKCIGFHFTKEGDVPLPELVSRLPPSKTRIVQVISFVKEP